MKKIITFLFVAFLVQAKAQIVFPAKGADWHYLTVNGLGGVNPSYYSNIEIKYTHDTVIDNHIAAVLSRGPSFQFYGGTNINYIYSSNDSVFFYNNYTIGKWQLLYCFNTPVGQSWKFRVSNSNDQTNAAGITWIVSVDSTGKLIVNNDTLKKMFVTYSDSAYMGWTYKSCIIERLGDTTYMFNTIDRALTTCDGCPFAAGILCYQDSTFNLYQPDTTKPCNYTTVGIKQLIDDEHIIIYPNPAQNTLQVFVSDDPITELKITDMLGKEMSCEALNIRQDKTQINVSGLKAGVYFITVKTKQANYAAKFIKE